MSEKVAYSIDEAAYALGLGRITVKKLIATGRLRSVRVGRRRLGPRPALVDYVEGLVRDQASA